MSKYPSIGDYALISDCHCNALVSRHGSVDWSCMPRMDDDSSFGRLLDWERGGHCLIAPTGGYTSTWKYVDGTMIVETSFRTDGGEARLTDFFAINAEGVQMPCHSHVRLVDGISGSVEIHVEICPRFDYGEIVPYIQKHGAGLYSAIGSNQGLIFHSDMPLEIEAQCNIYGRFSIHAGERRQLAIQFEFPERVAEAISRVAGTPPAMDSALDITQRWWKAWSAQMKSCWPLDRHTLRSTITLKALTYEPTGAIVAASTTSLPEWIGGGRNWDYRFSWVRDSLFTVRALHELGFAREAERFHGFIQRSAAGSAEQMQIMYGVDGMRRLSEVELDWLEGYRNSKPVRIGNAAAKQLQLDIYGELLEMAWEWHCGGHSTDPAYWQFLADVVDAVCRRWVQADHGIWEVRGEPLHYVHSKAMCWAAVNRGIQLALANGFKVPLERWSAVRDEIRDAIESRGFDAKRGVFVQAFDRSALDAAVLILPRIDFISYDDPRMLKTADAICEDLDCGGLLLRYKSNDGLDGPEGLFVPCTFWLVNCLARQGRLELANKYYANALACSNDLGLFSEEYDIASRTMLGNYPQGLTHLSQIMAWLALQESGAKKNNIV
ncbi:glycoside hydrolase family 15 protein [Noviherbaspirillum sp. CPCC 100848]|uniref:Glycoside hydrolase family 15 protein n=1 Tax=Noviherbaspirillum album TaxID=3080276 RepID=A0ABU6JI88_9BURK|nr:glycoside hydrolase family 15 protein [Noviherbaspirillum sp. CPCC 100848]MEC4723123.1 glycoside hydrolase family 15 protein [Noviherbaspirillum sp. CPCC 100848]